MSKSSSDNIHIKPCSTKIKVIQKENENLPTETEKIKKEYSIKYTTKTKKVEVNFDKLAKQAIYRKINKKIGY